MSAIWIIPALVLLVGGLAVAVMVRHAAEAAREVAVEMARFSEIRAAAARVQADVQRGRAAVRPMPRR